MITNRCKQAYQYFFVPFTSQMQEEVKGFLSRPEYEVFEKMGNYDKLHSYLLWKKVQRHTFSEQRLYETLALLHDCGKEKKSFWSRVSTVLLGRKRTKDRHSEKAYECLKHIDLRLAKACLSHHQKGREGDMKLFQALDDE